MGKYSHLKERFGPAPVTDQKWQNKVDELKNSLQYQQDPAQLSIEFRRLKDEKEALEAKIRELNVAIAAHDIALAAWLEEAGLTQFKTDDGDTLFIKDEPYTSVEDREKWMGWIQETKQEALLSVNYMTMNSIVKDRLQQGQPVPPGLKVYIKTGINIRRGSK